LHAAATVAAGTKIVVFGGAAKDGRMSNELFVLDTTTWTWTQPGKPDAAAVATEAPCPRAAPCLVGFDDETVVLYGGAEATPQGLQPLGDVWAFHLTTGTWQRLLSGDNGESSPNAGTCHSPPPRNAASLSCIASSSRDTTEVGPAFWRDYLLTGGWHPFVETRDDAYVLRVRRTASLSGKEP
jgi:hypothetical protein